jgi:Cd2+/Zn2+-exporting ATPase
MKTENTPVTDAASCCGASAQPVAAPVALGAGGQLFRIATMDCSAEESEIRRALEPIAGIRSLGFQLGARTLRIEASEDAYPLALEAIRKAGFDPQPARSANASQAGGHAGHDHSDGHTHDHSDGHGFGSGVTRLVAALVLAVGAEAMSFFASDVMAWKVAGMAIAAVAIALAGLDTYKKAWPPCCAASSTSTP